RGAVPDRGVQNQAQPSPGMDYIAPVTSVGARWFSLAEPAPQPGRGDVVCLVPEECTGTPYRMKEAPAGAVEPLPAVSKFHQITVAGLRRLVSAEEKDLIIRAHPDALEGVGNDLDG